LLNINDHIDTKQDDYKIEKQRFDALIVALIENGIVKGISSDEQITSTIQCCIADLNKFEEWKQRRFYRDITKTIIPLIEVGVSVAVNALLV